MRKRTRSIIALCIAGSMLASSGCGNNNLKKVYNEETKQEELIGTADITQINNYYIVELKDLEGNTDLFLTYKHKEFGEKNTNEVYRTIGTSNVIAIENYTSNYGEVLAIYPFTYFLNTYSELKTKYNAEEINEIFNKIKENYSILKEKEEVKKLKLKSSKE